MQCTTVSLSRLVALFDLGPLRHEARIRQEARRALSQATRTYAASIVEEMEERTVSPLCEGSRCYRGRPSSPLCLANSKQVGERKALCAGLLEDGQVAVETKRRRQATLVREVCPCNKRTDLLSSSLPREVFMSCTTGTLGS